MPLEHRDNPYHHWEFTDPSSGDQLRVVPERGGLITGWRRGGDELLYLDQERFNDPSLSVRGGVPVLFPITGGLPNNRLPLPQGDTVMEQHGFARTMPWKLQPLADGSGVELSLGNTAETLAIYPFPFRLVMEVRLAADSLEITTWVDNRGPEPMPFSFGLHPYFNVSDLGQVRVEGLPERCFDHLTMAEASTASQMQRIAEGIDLLVRPSGPVALVDPGAGRRITLDPVHPLDLVVLWSEPPRPMVCLEPWTGPRQSLLSGDRKLTLAPGERLRLQTTYRVSTG